MPLERSVSELSLDWVDWATVCSMAACVLVGPVDPLKTVFERAVSVGGVRTRVDRSEFSGAWTMVGPDRGRVGTRV